MLSSVEHREEEGNTSHGSSGKGKGEDVVAMCVCAQARVCMCVCVFKEHLVVQASTNIYSTPTVCHVVFLLLDGLEGGTAAGAFAQVATQRPRKDKGHAQAHSR